MKIEEDALKQLIEASEGDLRKAITFLQSMYRLKVDEAITSLDVIELAGVSGILITKNLVQISKYPLIIP